MPFNTYRDMALAVRRYIADQPQLNLLDREMESTDDDLEDAIKDTIIDMNVEYEPRTYWTITDVCSDPSDLGMVNFGVVKQGAILHVLIAKGIWSARNALNYSDAGGVNVSAMDKYQRYLPYIQYLQAQFDEGVKKLKLRYNIAQVYDSVNSPMGWDYYYG